MKKIVVTGATSMIGATLTRCAIQKNINVLCIYKWKYAVSYPNEVEENKPHTLLWAACRIQ